jgi:hypothetical protein
MTGEAFRRESLLSFGSQSSSGGTLTALTVLCRYRRRYWSADNGEEDAMCTCLILEMGYDGVKEKEVAECSDSSRAKRTARDADLLRYAMVDLFRRKNEVGGGREVIAMDADLLRYAMVDLLLRYAMVDLSRIKL